MKLCKRFRLWLQRKQFEADLAEEIGIHREMSGAPAFGSVALALEESRAVWGFAWLDSWKQDIRYALRGMRRSPGFALAVVGAIGLAIGLNTTMFTVFNAYVLRTFAVRDPYSLYGFTWYGRNGQGHLFRWDEYTALQNSATPFSDVIASVNQQGQVDGRMLFGQLVSGNYFNMLGVGTIQGRPLLPDDTGAVMVLSHQAWQHQFGGDPGLVGRKLYLRGRPFEVVGIANPGFVGLESFPGGFWIPLRQYSAVADGPDPFISPQEALKLIGRLRPGITPEAAKTPLLAWSRTAAPDAIGVAMISHATTIPLNRDAVFTFIPLFTAFGLVLLIACANVANLMLARALARRREAAIRVSLGAGRGRLIRQLLTESVVLAIPAAAAGFAVSQATIEGARRLLFATVPATYSRLIVLADLSTDWRVFGFVLAASLAAALVFGLAPAVQTTRSRIVETNRGDFSSDYRPARLRNLLVIVQVAVCALLLICTGIVLRSERNVMSRGTGLDTHGVWDLKMMERYQPRVAEHLSREPGIEAVAAAWHAPLYGSMRQMDVATAAGPRTVRIGYNFVSSGYFQVLRIPTVRGRIFSELESGAGVPVAVVSESAARRLWPGSDPLGQTLVIPPSVSHDPYLQRIPGYSRATVIGVVRDVVSGMLAVGGQEACLYLPTNPRAPHNDSILVRFDGDPGVARKHLEAALDQIAPSLSDMINPMDDVLAVQIYPFRIIFWLAGFLGGVGLLLTVSGIYGVMSYLVSQRTKEIGIRIAIGAGAWDVVRMVVRQSAWLAAIGASLGIALALMVAPVFAHELDAIRPYDWAPYAGTTAVVVIAATLASFRPARRAVAIDPVRTLRSD
jgi:predicted permease